MVRLTKEQQFQFDIEKKGIQYAIDKRDNAENDSKKNSKRKTGNVQRNTKKVKGKSKRKITKKSTKKSTTGAVSRFYSKKSKDLLSEPIRLDQRFKVIIFKRAKALDYDIIRKEYKSFMRVSKFDNADMHFVRVELHFIDGFVYSTKRTRVDEVPIELIVEEIDIHLGILLSTYLGGELPPVKKIVYIDEGIYENNN